MPRVAMALAVVSSLAGIACGTPPGKLRVSVPQTETAEVRLALKRGEKAASPADCRTPCTVEIPWDTAHEITIRAPGYYPASFEVTNDVSAPLSWGDTIPLVVPLIRRPAP